MSRVFAKEETIMEMLAAFWFGGAVVDCVKRERAGCNCGLTIHMITAALWPILIFFHEKAD